MMVHKKTPRYMPVTRDDRVVIVGSAPHETKTLHPDDASAEKAYDAEVKALRRKGFYTLAEHNKEKDAAEDLEEAAPERDRRTLLVASKDLEVKKLGTLVLSTGAIAACDPLSLRAPTPFEKKVSRGAYDVFVAIAKLPIKGRSKLKFDLRCAAAFVRFAKGAIARFEPAKIKPRRKGHKPSSAYGVDAGTGCFMDPEEVGEIDEKTSDAIVADLLSKKHPPTFSSAFLPANKAKGQKLVAFSSGFGDGVYECFWGLTKANVRAVLLTDFRVTP